ncbi:MAG: FIST N-terminal domain-containing protein [Verrucomicrobiota bacterium]
MKISQAVWTQTGRLTGIATDNSKVQLVLVFGATSVLRDANLISDLRNSFPVATIAGCSTAGEICGTAVLDGAVVVTAVTFDQTSVGSAQVMLSETPQSFAAGKRLAEQLPARVAFAGGERPLMHVLVLSDGSAVNGSELVRGLTQHLPPGVTLTGGLAGNGVEFNKTLVVLGGDAQEGALLALGFYSHALKVGYGSMGGWDTFGPDRVITRAKGNVLYELDGRSALSLYKQYLGDHAKDLPASGLLFPLSVRSGSGAKPVVRTILAVDEKEQSMTFAGQLNEGDYARLMKANFDRLIDGATGAARTCHQAIGRDSAELAILISCVGRKLILGQRIEEEVESVREVLGEKAVLTGFYSYGEISPFTPGAKCELHNQTMTITTFAES